jgi:hypothetical protein
MPPSSHAHVYVNEPNSATADVFFGSVRFRVGFTGRFITGKGVSGRPSLAPRLSNPSCRRDVVRSRGPTLCPTHVAASSPRTYLEGTGFLNSYWKALGGSL